MHHLILYHRGVRYVVHFADTTIYYLRLDDGTIIEYEDIPPALLADIETILLHV